MVELTFFRTQCRGVKFYSLKEEAVHFWSKAYLVRKPFNVKDPNCVEVQVRCSDGHVKMLGHITKEAAEWLSPMLLGPFTIFATVHNHRQREEMSTQSICNYVLFHLNTGVSHLTCTLGIHLATETGDIGLLTSAF